MEQDIPVHEKQNHNTASDLHVAIYSQNAEVVLKCAQNKKIINSFWRGSTAVSSALYLKRYDLLEILVKNDADCNLCTRNNKMEPPLFAACRLRDERAIALFLNSSSLDLEQKDFFGRTPLWAAARYCVADVVEILLNRGAMLNTNLCCKFLPISGAFLNNSRHANQIIKLLVRRGSFLKSVCEVSPLKWALHREDREMFSLLVSAGCKVKSEDWLSYDNLPEGWKKDSMFCDWIGFLKTNPVPLQTAAVCTIRNILSMKFDTLQEYHVKTLGLPASLNSIILFTKLLNE